MKLENLMFIFAFVAVEDLKRIKHIRGGRKTVKECTKDIMCVIQASHRFPQQPPRVGRVNL